MITPDVSVIVPVYKAEDYICRCVDSLLSQTFRNFEVLLIDDGSPDRSGAICDDYARQDSRIRVIHKANGGVSSARQCGLDHALGEYVIHADPDDWVESSMLEELYAQAKRDNADMVLCDFFDNVECRQIYRKQQPSALDSSTVQLEMVSHLGGGMGMCWNKLVRRSCFSQYNVRFPEELSYCEDLYVNVSLLKHPIEISYLPKAFYHYDRTSNPNSICKSHSLLDLEYMEMLYRKFQELTIGERCYNACQYSMSALVVSHAFHGHFFDSRTFKRNCKKYRQGMLRSGHLPLWFKCLLNVSCLGGYNFAYAVFMYARSLYRMYHRLKFR